MDSTQILDLILMVVCLLFSAYFSVSETAFTTMNKARLKTQAEEGDKRAARAMKVSEDSKRLLSTILIGDTIANILTVIFSTLLFTDL